MIGNKLVFFGIPLVDVYSVDNALELVVPLGQNPVKAAALLGGLDLLGVGGADGGDVVGVHQACLQHVHLAVGEDVLVRPDVGVEEVHAGECSLICQVVDGEHRLCAHEELASVHLQKIGNKACSPVMAVKDIRFEVYCLAQLQRGLAHKSKAEEVVAVRSEACVAVDSDSVVEDLVTYKVIDYSSDRLHTDLDLLSPIEHRDIELAHKLSAVLDLHVVCRNHYAGIMAFLNQSRRQCSDYISKSA